MIRLQYELYNGKYTFEISLYEFKNGDISNKITEFFVRIYNLDTGSATEKTFLQEKEAVDYITDKCYRIKNDAGFTTYLKTLEVF